ncbi:tetratricopeptide repeat protein [Patescibacteria group bacterium]
MQLNLKTHSKKAIEAALTNDWKKAIDLNEEILLKDPNNKEAKIRLGRAFIKTEKFSKAKKLFKEVLEIDPINQIAQKNYKLASEKNADRRGGDVLTKSARLLIKEPGTTMQIVVKTTKKIADTFDPGEKLNITIKKSSIELFDKDSKQAIGEINGDLGKSIYAACKGGKDVYASVGKTNNDSIIVILKCKLPIFKAEKQQEKPYMKKGVIEETENKIPELEQAEE